MNPFNPLFFNTNWLDAAYMSYTWPEYLRQHQHFQSQPQAQPHSQLQLQSPSRAALLSAVVPNHISSPSSTPFKGNLYHYLI